MLRDPNETVLGDSLRSSYVKSGLLLLEPNLHQVAYQHGISY